MAASAVAQNYPVKPIRVIVPFPPGNTADILARLLAITNDKRIDYLPGVPTIGEAVPGYVSQGWFGYIAPAAVPKDIISLLNREIIGFRPQ